MAYGAGWVAAEKFGAARIIDPRAFAVETLKVVEEYPLPAGIVQDWVEYYPRLW